MNAERMAERLEQHHAAFNASAAAMLRRQHEAIVKLREALIEMKAHATHIESKVGYLSAKRKQEVGQIYNLAAQALKDTEDLK
jgi:predicted transcriptional regulator